MDARQPSRSVLPLVKEADENARKMQALKAILGAVALGAGGGAAARGLVGLTRMLSPKPILGADSRAGLPRMMRVPVMRHHENEDGVPQLEMTSPPPPPNLTPAPYKYASSNEPLRAMAAALVKEAAGEGGGLIDKLPGTAGASAPQGAWWAIPSIVGGGAVGLYGGWSLIDALLKRRRKAEMQGALDDAKRNYREALMRHYQGDMLAKGASAPDTDTDDWLDVAFEGFEKQGEGFTDFVRHYVPGGQVAVDAGNAALGSYLTALGVLTLGAGKGMYDWTKSRSRAKVLQQALAKRKAERARRLPPVLAVTEDVEPSEYETA